MNERAPIEFRAAVPLERVDYEQRTIELVAVPWDEWATVEYRGRMIEESFAPGAFGAVDRRNEHRRVLVNLDHDLSRWVGRVESLDPRDPVGLRTELRIRRTPEGEQTLVDAADGMLGGSVGFGALPANIEWSGRSRRRIRVAYLDHIALTATPAYVGAQVVDVRNAPGSSSTPNLDRVLAERAEQAYPQGV